MRKRDCLDHGSLGNGEFESRPMATEGSDNREVGAQSVFTLPPVMFASSPSASLMSCGDKSAGSTPTRLAQAWRASSQIDVQTHGSLPISHDLHG